jgi:uncharacterized protein YqgC (DUF456 family)
MATILWIIAVVLVIAGIVQLVRGGIVPGIVLIVVGLLVGPGGVSIFG